MIKLLIADDEPLVCVGIQSMLKWEELEVEIVGTARNGQQALDMIRDLQPDIVITDIKMPLLTGLELIKSCRETYGRVPLFIVLSSYEEFEYVRKAMKYQAVDYLIKLELDADALKTAVTKAILILREVKHTPAMQIQKNSMQALREKFFIRLFNSLFDSDEQYCLQREDLGIDFSASHYAVGYCEIQISENAPVSGEKLLSLCTSTTQMVKETLSRFLPCYVTTLDLRHFTIILCLSVEQVLDLRTLASNALQKTLTLLHNYFSVSIRVALGHPVDEPRLIGASYQSARRGFHETSRENPIVFCNVQHSDLEESSHLHEIRTGIRRAMEEIDTGTLTHMFTAIAGELSAFPERRLQAMDAAYSILYMAISLLPDGEKMVEQVFSHEPDGYRVIYRLKTAEEIAEWIRQLRDGLGELLPTQKHRYKRQVISNIQEYIQSNLKKKLTLNSVAAAFNFSPNYLSQLFAKYTGESFVEYITGVRIAAAKELLNQGEIRIYEVAEQLGFESAFYFSKVFKKVEGISPREYLQKLENAESAYKHREV